MPLPNLTTLYADQRARAVSELDRYVQREYGDDRGTWFTAAAATRFPIQATDGGVREGRFVRLRRAARAFAALF